MVQLHAEASSAKKEEEDDSEDEDEEEDSEEDSDDDDVEDNFDQVLEDRGYFEEDDDDADFDDYEESSEDAYRKAKAKMNMLKGSPLRFEKTMWQIRGRSYRDSLMMLEFLPWKNSKMVLKCLQMAGNRAQNKMNMDKARLYVHSAQAYECMRMKRMRPKSKGQPMFFYRKKTRIEIVVKEWTDREIEENKQWLGIPRGRSDMNTVRAPLAPTMG